MCPPFEMPRYLQIPHRHLGKQRRKYKWDHDNWKNSLECHSNLKIKSEANQLSSLGPIKLTVWKRIALKKNSAEASMSRLLRNSRTDGHVNMCKSFNWHFITSASSPHKLITQRTEWYNLHIQTYLLLMLWLLDVKRCIFQSGLSNVLWLQWWKTTSMERTSLR